MSYLVVIVRRTRSSILRIVPVIERMERFGNYANLANTR
jgi:hypothetical protein